MPKDAPGRNDPCPCGSGKKYKKCCLGSDTDAGGPLVEANEPPSLDPPPGSWMAGVPPDLLQLDDWMHEGEHAVEDGRLERAEELSRKVREGFPDLIHGHYLLGKIRGAQGRWSEAAAAFEEALRVIDANRQSYRDAVRNEIQSFLDEARAKQNL